MNLKEFYESRLKKLHVDAWVDSLYGKNSRWQNFHLTYYIDKLVETEINGLLYNDW